MWNAQANIPSEAAGAFTESLCFDVATRPPERQRGAYVRCDFSVFRPVGIGVYSRGPKGELSLRAQNLVLFLQLAKGMDDARENFLALIYIERQQREVEAALLLVKTPAAQQE